MSLLSVLLLAVLSLVNPVSKPFADTFADPTVVRGQDGLWYAYGTSDPLRSGERVLHRIPIARSADLTTWSYVGDALDDADLPAYVAPGSSFWAPDVRYLDGRYVMYFTVTDTTVSPEGSDFAVGAATAPTPAGPWTIADEPVVAPRPGPGGGYWNTIDPAELTDSDGTRYLYFGGYYGGLWVTELSPDGLRAVGSPTMVAIDNRYEGPYVVRRDGYYYLFASSANCCAGPTTGYAVSVGRATSPRGPFVDAAGLRLDVSRAGGTPVVTQNGNRWIGPGHNGLLTDLSGQDYLVYHAIDPSVPYLDEAYGVNRRPMLIDRLDWIGGWPVVRAGAGPSDSPQPAPVTRGSVTFADRPSWLPRDWRVGDGHATGSGTVVVPGPARGDVRVEADVRPGARAAAGIIAGGATAWLDRSAGRLVVDAGHGRRASQPLPAGLDYGSWHNLAVSVHGATVTAELTEARQSGPVVSISLRGASGRGRAGFTSRGLSDVDNFSALPLYHPVTRPASVPSAGRLVFADDFSGDTLTSGWSWVRPDPTAAVHDGQLAWPVQDGDIVGTDNVASVLLRDALRGDYTVETKLTLDLAEDTIRNYQQAGLVAYVNDDNFARFSQVAIWNTRQLEFGRELPYAGRLAWGGTTVGTPAATTWLRLAHRVDPATGEHRFRSASSRDGVHWTWGGTWTIPADQTPRIGLVALGGAAPAVTAYFDYLRVYRP